MPQSSFFEGDFSSPFDIGKAYTGGYGDFGSKASGTVARPKRNIDWGELSDTVSSLFSKARDTDKYRDYAYRSSPAFGDWSKGGGGQVLENLGVVYPQQQGPMYLPGTEGRRSGVGSAIGTLAGIGASFIPGLGPGIAAAMPAIGGSVGSFFG